MYKHDMQAQQLWDVQTCTNMYKHEMATNAQQPNQATFFPRHDESDQK